MSDDDSTMSDDEWAAAMRGGMVGADHTWAETNDSADEEPESAVTRVVEPTHKCGVCGHGKDLESERWRTTAKRWCPDCDCMRPYHKIREDD